MSPRKNFHVGLAVACGEGGGMRGLVYKGGLGAGEIEQDMLTF